MSGPPLTRWVGWEIKGEGRKLTGWGYCHIDFTLRKLEKKQLFF